METTSTLPYAKSTKGLNLSLWVAQIILAVFFGMTGFAKLTTPIDLLGQQIFWVADVSPTLVRFIGLAELLGAIGLILPSLFRIMPKLTSYAALGLALTMINATAFHITRGEYSVIGLNLLLAIIAVFIAWGRFFKAPITSIK